MKIVLIGKKGCSKCAKMDLILKGRGHETELIYADKIGKMTYKDKPIEITEETHFPIYVTDKGVFLEFRDLTDNLG